MTLGRVYVPPNRTNNNNQFVSTSFKSNNIYNNNNNVIVNGYSDSSSLTNGFRKIEIKVEKKEVGKKKSDEAVRTQPEKHSETKPEINGINNSTNINNIAINGNLSHSNKDEEEAQAVSDDVEWELEEESAEKPEAVSVEQATSEIRSIPIKISVETSQDRDVKNEEEEEQIIPSRWKELEEEQDGDDADEEDEADVGKVSNGGEVSCVNGSIFSGLPNNAKGLKNLGNTCFMNSIIQCLANTETLLEFCQSYDSVNVASNFIGKVASTAKEPRITRAFVRLVQEMWKGAYGSGGGSNHGVADPSGFRREMTVFAPKFGGYDQHDSQEFLQYVLEGLHGEMNRSEQPPAKKKEKPEVKVEDQNGNGSTDENDNTEKDTTVLEATVKESKEVVSSLDDIDAPGISAEEKGRRAWKQYLKRDNSFITDLFLGQFRSTLKCSECGHESVTFEPFWVVSVQINPKTSKDISDCLELFVAEETLDGDEKPTCESCKTKQKCTKWYSFERWPKILVIHLKRFAPTGSYRAKLSQLIDTPLRNLDLSSFSSNILKQSSSIKTNGCNKNVIYDCYAISNHSGTLSGGHYTAYCRHPHKTHNWHLYNDRSVSGANPDHVVTGEAYLLFFERKDFKTD